MQAPPIVWEPMKDWALAPSAMPLRVGPATLGGAMPPVHKGDLPLEFRPWLHPLCQEPSGPSGGESPRFGPPICSGVSLVHPR